MNSQQNNPPRRELLKAAALIPACGLLKLPLQKAFASNSPASEKVCPELQEQLLKLNADEQANLTFLLVSLKENEPPLVLKPFIVAGCVAGARMQQQLMDHQAQDDEKHKAYCQQRDRLTGQARVKFVAQRLKGTVGFYRADFQKEVFALVAAGAVTPPENPRHGEGYRGSLNCAFGIINKHLDGCSKSFRRKVADYYLAHIWPKKKAEDERETALEKAWDEWADLTAGKTPEQIRVLIAKVKQVT
ncbi:MAG: hypothetical protein ACYS4W_05670 [Planctomycetota bacterium]|jgi:hypothetical protein